MPAVLQLPIGSESEFAGVIDLVTMTVMILAVIFSMRSIFSRLGTDLMTCCYDDKPCWTQMGSRGCQMQLSPEHRGVSLSPASSHPEVYVSRVRSLGRVHS